MKKTSLIFIASLLSFAVLLMVSGCDDNATEVTPPVEVTSLNSALVTTPPTLDGVGTDAAWADASTYMVTVGQTLEYQNEFGEVDVTLKSVHTSTDIYIFASWADSTENVDKNQWTYGANGWAKSGNEDRIFFMFDAGDNGTEGADCATMCHFADGTMSTTGGGHVDVWHWKAARTAPVGCADDKWWDGTDRGSDAKTIGAYSDNIQTLADSSNVPKYSGPVSADGHFIIIPSGDSAAGYCTTFDTTATTGTYPGYYLNENRDGSRFADVSAQSTYSNGIWTVEFKRALDTGHTDDVAFVAGTTVKFSMAVTDNSGGNHSGIGNLDLVIE